MKNNIYDILEIKKEEKPNKIVFSAFKEIKILLKGLGICIVIDIFMIIILSSRLSGWNGLWTIFAPCLFTVLFIFVFLATRAVFCLKNRHWTVLFIYTLILMILVTLINYFIVGR